MEEITKNSVVKICQPNRFKSSISFLLSSKVIYFAYTEVKYSLCYSGQKFHLVKNLMNALEILVPGESFPIRIFMTRP